MSDNIEYFLALDRLKEGKPEIVKLGTKISNDSVAMEAGRGKGAIKKCRDGFEELIVAIKKASEEQAKNLNRDVETLNKKKEEVVKYRELYEDALSREVMLVKRLYELEAKLLKYTAR